MNKNRLEIKIKSAVITKDGNCGSLQQLVLDPHQEKIVGLVVQPDLLPDNSVIVPVEQVVDAKESEIRLKLDYQQVLSLPEYKSESPLTLGQKNYFIVKNEFITRGPAGIEVFCAPTSTQPGMVESQMIEEQQLPLAAMIHARQQVFWKGQNVGIVQLLLLDPSGKVRGFVMRTRRRGHRDLIVPVDWIQEADPKNVHLMTKGQALETLDEFVPDAVLVSKIEQVIWKNNTLPMIHFSEMSCIVQDGIVTLCGYVPTSTDKLLVENAVKSIPGVLGIQNQIVSDFDLTIEVAQDLGRDKRTRLAMVSVNTRRGIVSLDGKVKSASIRDAAETIAASVPTVRGVMNFIEAPGVSTDPAEECFQQPLIGQEVYESSNFIGRVERVIINPHNRQVTMFVVQVVFSGSKIIDPTELVSEDTRQVRHINLPNGSIHYIAGTTVFLEINGMEVAGYKDFDAKQYAKPPVDWQPPYPYRKEDILFRKASRGDVKDESIDKGGMRKIN